MDDITAGYDPSLTAAAGEEEEKQEERVHDWEAGLPTADELTPLNHSLVPPGLLSAFNIKLEPTRTSGEVIRASQETLSTIRIHSISSKFKPFDEDDDYDTFNSKKPRQNESPEDTDSMATKTLKRQRLVWTPQLHKRFVDVVNHLGVKTAVPKTIMQLMNVEGLTRENVASHLQKYRLYVKRMQGVSFDGGVSNSSAGASTEQLFSSMLPLGNSQENAGVSPMMSMGMSNYSGFEPRHHNKHNHHNNMYNDHHNKYKHKHNNHSNKYNDHHQQQHRYNGMMQMANLYGPSVSSHHHHRSSHVAHGDK